MPIRARCFIPFVRPACLIVLLFASTQSFAQSSCTTFNGGTLENWTSQNTSSPTIKTRGPGDSYIELKDSSGPSALSAPSSLLGNLVQKLGCGQICFDVNLFKNGSDAPPVLHPSFSLQSGAITANFVANLGISAGDGWHNKVCAPIASTAPNTGPTTSPDGTWVVNPPGSWNTLITNVTGLKLPVDYGSSTQNELVGYDNICFQPGTCGMADFPLPKPACAGDAVQFTNTSTSATTFAWSFTNGNPATSTQTNPSASFPAGSHPVKLCINGGTATPLCVTKTVTIKPKPPAPVINGPVTSCNAPATYCVSPVNPSLTYNWSVSSPHTITGSSTGSCVQVTWSPPGQGGVVTVTATNKAGCSSLSRIEVKPCVTSLAECCQCNELSVKNETLSGSTFSAVITASPMPMTRVAVDLISTTVTPFGPGCGTAGPRDSSINVAGSSLPPLANVSQPVTPGREILFGTTTPAPLVNAPLTLNLQLPPVAKPHFWCGDFLRFCLKYSFTGRDCKTCELIECYGPYRRGGFIITDPGPRDVNINQRFDLSFTVPDGGGTPRPTPGDRVTLRIKPGTGAPGARLLGTTQVDLTGTTVTFIGLSVDTLGEGYVLELLSGASGEAVAESAPFNVGQQASPR